MTTNIVFTPVSYKSCLTLPCERCIFFPCINNEGSCPVSPLLLEIEDLREVIRTQIIKESKEK